MDEQKLQELVMAAMNNDEKALQTIQQIQQAAQQGDQEAASYMEAIQSIMAQLQNGGTEQPEAYKCGGRVRAKMKKAACGGKAKKCQNGGIPVTYKTENKMKSVTYGRKGTCACALKKVGGKIIEVDTCTGLPIHKEGGPIVKAGLGWLVNNAVRGAGDLSGTIAGKVAEYGKKGAGYLQSGIGAVARDWTNGTRGNGWIKEGGRKRATAEATGQRVNRAIDEASAHAGNIANGVVVAGETLIHPALGVAGAAGDYALTKGVGLYDPTTGGATKGVMPKGYASAPAAATPSAPSSPVYGGMFSGNMRSLAARQNWVRQNADYLRSQGWSDDQINNYRGSAADNASLRSLMGGAEAWNAKNAQMNQAALAERQQRTMPTVNVGGTPTAQDAMAAAGQLQMQRPQISKFGGLLSYSNYLY